MMSEGTEGKMIKRMIKDEEEEQMLQPFEKRSPTECTIEVRSFCSANPRKNAENCCAWVNEQMWSENQLIAISMHETETEMEEDGENMIVVVYRSKAAEDANLLP